MIMEMILRTTTTFFVLLFFARILGKEQVSQLTFFNYITGITIGSIAAEMAGQSETPFWNGMVSLIWWTVLSLVVSVVSIKSLKWKQWLDDEPSIVIKQGQLQNHVLRKKRLPVEDLLMLMRLQGVFSFQEVSFAILETNGQLSIWKTDGTSPVTKADMKVAKTNVKQLPTTVLQEGKWLYNVCAEIGVKPQQIATKLRGQGYMNPSKLFLVQWHEDGSLYVSREEE